MKRSEVESEMSFLIEVGRTMAEGGPHLAVSGGIALAVGAALVLELRGIRDAIKTKVDDEYRKYEAMV